MPHKGLRSLQLCNRGSLRQAMTRELRLHARAQGRRDRKRSTTARLRWSSATFSAVRLLASPSKLSSLVILLMCVCQ